MWELFHAIGDAPSAYVRRRVVELQLESHIRFRNVMYPEVRSDLESRGGRNPPALWDGAHLISDVDEMSQALLALSQGQLTG